MTAESDHLENIRTLFRAPALEWMGVLEDADRIIAEQEARKALANEKLRAIETLAERPISELLGIRPELKLTASMSLREGLVRVLEIEQVGRTATELAHTLRDTPLAERAATPNYVYTILNKLADAGSAVKKGRLYYRPDLFDRVARGEVDDPRFESGGELQSDIHAAILQVLTSTRRWLTPAEILDHIRQLPAEGLKEVGGTGYFYTLLGRMVVKGEIAKRDKLYGAIENEEPPSTSEEGSTLI